MTCQISAGISAFECLLKKRRVGNNAVKALIGNNLLNSTVQQPELSSPRRCLAKLFSACCAACWSSSTAVIVAALFCAAIKLSKPVPAPISSTCWLRLQTRRLAQQCAKQASVSSHFHGALTLIDLELFAGKVTVSGHYGLDRRCWATTATMIIISPM